MGGQDDGHVVFSGGVQGLVLDLETAGDDEASDLFTDGEILDVPSITHYDDELVGIIIIQTTVE